MGSYTTRVVDKEEYKLLIDTLKAGYTHKGIRHKPNRQAATVLILERNLGMRLSDIISLRLEDIIKEGNTYRLDVIEKKTGKKRTFTVPLEVKNFIDSYARTIGIDHGRLFTVTSPAIWKAVRQVTEYLDMKRVNTHSVRKAAGVALYEQTNYNLEMVREFYQHSSIATTQTYIRATSGAMQKALNGIIDLG